MVLHLLFVDFLLAEQDSSEVLGCRDPIAKNYNREATVDDGSCIYGYANNNKVAGVAAARHDSRRR